MGTILQVSSSYGPLIHQLQKKTSEGQPDTEAANPAQPDTNSQNTSEAADVSASLLSPLVTWGITDQIFKSEILWAIQTTVNHNSHQSNRNTSCLFEVMFPDYHVVYHDLEFEQLILCSIFKSLLELIFLFSYGQT